MHSIVSYVAEQTCSFTCDTIMHVAGFVKRESSTLRRRCQAICGIGAYEDAIKAVVRWVGECICMPPSCTYPPWDS